MLEQEQSEIVNKEVIRKILMVQLIFLLLTGIITSTRPAYSQGPDGQYDINELYDICVLDPIAKQQIADNYAIFMGEEVVVPNEQIGLDDEDENSDIEITERDLIITEQATPQILQEGEEIDPSKIIFSENPKPTDFNIILVGTSYSDSQELKEDMENIEQNGEAFFDELPINIIYITENLQLQIEGSPDFPYLSDPDNLINAINNTEFPVGVIAVVMNSDQYIGTGGTIPVFAGHTENELSLFVHEVVGHRISGFSDGYPRQYNESQLLNNLTEFYIPGTPIDPRIQAAMLTTGLGIDQIPDLRCGHVPVFSIGASDIMDMSFTTDQMLLFKLDVFNPAQRQVIWEIFNQG